MNRHFVIGLVIGGIGGYLLMKVHHYHYVADVYRVLAESFGKDNKLEEKENVSTEEATE